MRSPRWIDFSLGLAFAVVLLATFFACEEYIRKNKPIATTIFDASEEEGQIIKNQLEMMYPRVRSKISMIIVVEEIDRQSSAHCYKIQDPVSSIILIERKHLRTTALWHEVIHSREYVLPLEALEEWRALGNRPPYLNNEWLIELLNQYPQKGTVSPYGRKNEHEDIATWGEAIYSKLNSTPSPLDQSFDRDNPIYSKILAWFLKWQFISSDHYQQLINQLF